MKVVVLYENKRNRAELIEELKKAGHDVITCTSSSDFLEAAERDDVERLIIDVKSWFRGTSIYNYFNITSKLTEIPALFFDAPDGFNGIDGRPELESDVILEKERSVDAILAALV